MADEPINPIIALQDAYYRDIQKALGKHNINVEMKRVGESGQTKFTFARDSKILGTATREITPENLTLSYLKLTGRTGVIRPLYQAEAEFAQAKSLPVDILATNTITEAKFKEFYPGYTEYIEQTEEGPKKGFQWKPGPALQSHEISELEFSDKFWREQEGGFNKSQRQSISRIRRITQGRVEESRGASRIFTSKTIGMARGQRGRNAVYGSVRKIIREKERRKAVQIKWDQRKLERISRPNLVVDQTQDLQVKVDNVKKKDRSTTQTRWDKRRVDRLKKKISLPDKIANGYKGLGFVAGAVGTGIAYTMFGRAPHDEALEKVGAKPDSPLFDAMVGGGAAYGINKLLKNHKAFPSLKDMFVKGLHSEPPIKSLKSQAFKIGGFGLVGYGITALGHNLVNNEPGEGWRYPLLSAAAGVAGVYANTIYNAYDGKMDDIALDAHHTYQEKVGKLKDAPILKSINASWSKATDGSLIPGDSALVKNANAIIKGAANSTPAKIAVGVGVVTGLMTALSGSENSYDSEPIIQTGRGQSTSMAMSSGYNNAMARSVTSYRPPRRYNQSYRNERYNNNSQPHGLGLV